MKLHKGWIFCLLFLFVVFLLPASYVSAHSALVDTFPKGGEELSASPKSIEVWFKDPVTVHSDSIKVVNEVGRTFPAEKVQNDPNDKGHILTKLKESLPVGNYKVNVDVITPDGYVTSEKFSFKVVENNVNAVNEDLKLLRSSPGDGEISKNSINKLELWFNQPVNIKMLGLFNDQKVPVNIKQPTIDPDDPTHVIIEAPNNLSQGTYQVSWFGRALQQETEKFVPQSMGVYYFAVDKFTPMNPSEAKPKINWFEYMGLKQLSYWISFIGLCLLFGLSFFNIVIVNVKEYPKRWKIIQYFLALLTVIGIGIFLTELRKEVGSNVPLNEFLQLKFAVIPIIQAILVVVGVFFRKVAIFLFSISLFIWPFVMGHSSYPRYGGWLTMAINELHLFAVAIWLGGLFALIIFAPKNHENDWLKKASYRFSKWAFGCVVIIAVSGIWMSINFIPSFSMESIIRSAFGRALFIKIALFMIMLIIALFQRRLIKYLSAKLVKIFVYKLRVELLYGIIVLFFASVLVVSTPSAAEQGIYPNKMTKDGVELSIDIEPLFTGYSEVTLDFNKNPEVESALVTFSMPPDWEKTNEAFKVSQGTFKLTGMLLHAAGTVYMDIEVKKTNGEIVTFPFTVVVPGEIRFNE